MLACCENKVAGGGRHLVWAVIARRIGSVACPSFRGAAQQFAVGVVVEVFPSVSVRHSAGLIFTAVCSAGVACEQQVGLDVATCFSGSKWLVCLGWVHKHGVFGRSVGAGGCVVRCTFSSTCC